jgi:hypothetical protein
MICISGKQRNGSHDPVHGMTITFILHLAYSHFFTFTFSLILGGKLRHFPVAAIPISPYLPIRISWWALGPGPSPDAGHSSHIMYHCQNVKLFLTAPIEDRGISLTADPTCQQKVDDLAQSTHTQPFTFVYEAP